MIKVFHLTSNSVSYEFCKGIIITYHQICLDIYNTFLNYQMSFQQPFRWIFELHWNLSLRVFENISNESQACFTKYNSYQLKCMSSSTHWIPGVGVKEKLKKNSSKWLTAYLLSYLLLVPWFFKKIISWGKIATYVKAIIVFLLVRICAQIIKCTKLLDRYITWPLGIQCLNISRIWALTGINIALKVLKCFLFMKNRLEVEFYSNRTWY